MRDYLEHILIGVVALFVGAVLGNAFAKWFTPPKVVTKTEVVTQIEYRQKVVYREAEAKVIYRDVVRTVTVTKDGTKTTTTTDHSTEHADTTTTAERDTTSHTDSTTKTTKTVSTRPTVRVGALLGVGIKTRDGFLKDVGSPLAPAWVGAEVSSSVIGPVFLGGWAITNGRDVVGGVSLGLEF